jgi:hypothetical protein
MSPLGERLRHTLEILSRDRLPGEEPLRSAHAVTSEVQAGTDGQAIKAFVIGHKALEHGLERLRQLEDHLHDAALEQLRAARRAVETEWPALQMDGNRDARLEEASALIHDVLAKETFFNEMATVAAETGRIQDAYSARHEEAAAELTRAYQEALGRLVETLGWKELDEEVRNEIAEPLRRRADGDPARHPLAMLRETTLACPGILKSSVERVVQASAIGADPDVVIVSEVMKGRLISNEEQLDVALGEVRDRCLRSIADGNPVLLA